MATQIVDGEVVEMTPAQMQELAEARQMLAGASAPPTPFIPLSMMRQRVERLGLLDAFSAYLAANPPLMMKLFSLEGGSVDPAYPALVDAFDAINVPTAARAYILAPPSAGVGDPPAVG